MRQRIITAILMIVALVALLVLGGWYFAVAAIIAIILCIYEENKALLHRKHRPVIWPSYAALLISAPLMIYFSATVIIPVLTIAIFCVLLQVMQRDDDPNLTDVMVSTLPLLTLVLPAMSLFGILDTPLRSMQAMLLTMVFAIAIGGDTFALFAGTWIGGKKLCPRISPKKTVAGAVGGLAGSMLLTWLTGYLFSYYIPTQVFPPLWANLLVGFLGGVAAQMGDLFASLVKRHCGIKDFGTLFPGHGGMLDRMDSILFSAIIVYSYRVLVMSYLGG